MNDPEAAVMTRQNFVIRSDAPGTPNPELCSKDEVLAFEFPDLVDRIHKKLCITQEEAVSIFEDTKKFLCLCGASKENLAPPPAIDAGWHEFLMYTKEYGDFCRHFFGTFIHHCPRRRNEPNTGVSKARRTLELARQAFGQDLSKNWVYPYLRPHDLLDDVNAKDPCDSCGCSPLD